MKKSDLSKLTDKQIEQECERIQRAIEQLNGHPIEYADALNERAKELEAEVMRRKAERKTQEVRKESGTRFDSWSAADLAFALEGLMHLAKPGEFTEKQLALADQLIAAQWRALGYSLPAAETAVAA